MKDDANSAVYLHRLTSLLTVEVYQKGRRSMCPQTTASTSKRPAMSARSNRSEAPTENSSKATPSSSTPIAEPERDCQRPSKILHTTTTVSLLPNPSMTRSQLLMIVLFRKSRPSAFIIRSWSIEYVMPVANVCCYSVPNARSHGVSQSTLHVPALALASRRLLMIRGAQDSKGYFLIHPPTGLGTAPDIVYINGAWFSLFVREFHGVHGYPCCSTLPLTFLVMLFPLEYLFCDAPKDFIRLLMKRHSVHAPRTCL